MIFHLCADERKVEGMKKCVECKKRFATHWGAHLCEECFRELLKEKVEKEDEK
jgi:ribosomal protein L34E